MRRIIISALAGLGLAGFVLAGSAWAQDTDTSQGAQGTQGAQGMAGTTAGNEITGKVQSVDTKNNTLTLSDGKQLMVTPSTQVMKNGTTASLSDIRQGDEVRASFTPGSTTSVQQLTATSPSGAPGGGAPGGGTSGY